MTYQSINPYTGEFIKGFEELSNDALEGVLAKAHETYQKAWRSQPVAERAAVLRLAATLLRERTDELSTLASLEMGKLVGPGKGEIELSASILEYYADHAEEFIAPRKIEVSTGTATVLTQSLGVIFCIEPWNFPYYQLARVAGPNLAIGNTVIAKHAQNVPQCALAFEKVLADAGAPEGVYTNVFISNDQSATLIADARVRGVALTGSERAGTAVAAEAGKALKKSTMELGGSDAFVVLDDADVDLAVKIGAASRLFNAGQVCNAAKRFIVSEKVYDAFLAKFKTALADVVLGDPRDAATTLGPLNSEGALNLTLKQLESAVSGGATVLLGGNRIKRDGFFLEPTILTDVSPSNPVYYQEFFAPVAMVFPVKDDDDAIRLANDSRSAWVPR